VSLNNSLDSQPQTRYNTHMKNLDQIRDDFPEAQIERDNDGQYIIYTGIYQERTK